MEDICIWGSTALAGLWNPRGYQGGIFCS